MRFPLTLALFVLALFPNQPATAETFNTFDEDFHTPPLSAALIGDFNNWDHRANVMEKTDTGFTIDVPLADGQYAYAYWMEFPSGAKVLVQDQRSNIYTLHEESVCNLIYLRNGIAMIPEGLELFTFEAPNAEDVVVAGNFNGWYQGNMRLFKNERGEWQGWLKAERPLIYKYVVDDLWTNEESNPEVELLEDGFGGFNCARLGEGDIHDTETIKKEASHVVALDVKRLSPTQPTVQDEVIKSAAPGTMPDMLVDEPSPFDE